MRAAAGLFVWLVWVATGHHRGGVSAAGGDCMATGSPIRCFECNSFEDARCHDPFNYTWTKSDMPPLVDCRGCCVKMVQFIGTEHYQVRRTCTDKFEVNLFILNHACMTEGHRHGHMCLCEEDECNVAASQSKEHILALVIVLAAEVSVFQL